MAEFLSIRQTDAKLLGCLLRQLAGRVRLGGEVESVGGVGYTQIDDVLLRKRPLAGKLPLPERLAEGLNSEAVLVSVGAASLLPRGAFSEESTFPFRFRRWLFALGGRAEELGPCRPKLLEGIPDYLRRSAKGDSAAMAVFFTFLSRLREAGRLDDSDVDEATVGRALAGAVGEAQRVFEGLGQPMPGLAAVVTNGRVLAGLSRGHPLHLLLHEGLFGCARCELPADAPDNDPKVRAHRMLKAAVLLSGEPPLVPGYRTLDEGEVVAVGRGMNVRRV